MSQKDNKSLPFEEGNRSYFSYDDWKESSNPSNDSLQQVSYTFFTQERDHFDFLMKIKSELVSINAFFQAVIRLYVEGDERIMSIVREIRASYKSKNQEKQREKILKLQEEERRRFSLDEAEVEDLFDIIEGENED